MGQGEGLAGARAHLRQGELEAALDLLQQEIERLEDASLDAELVLLYRRLSAARQRELGGFATSEESEVAYQRVARAILNLLDRLASRGESKSDAVEGPTCPKPAAESTTTGVFVSYASEEKESIAGPIAAALVGGGVHVWFDETDLRLGSSVFGAVGDGLQMCRFAVAILSPSYFAKSWTMAELTAVFSREMAERREILLPVMHEVTARDVAQRLPLLADRKAVPTTLGISVVVARIVDVLGRDGRGGSQDSQRPLE
jgi:hypothetical protein